jgi:LPS O-antigen subunit length determinant protein (WzzB/FepE family)
MNQTRLLIGILLLLAAVFGYTQWSNKQDLRQQREETAKLIEVLSGKSPDSTAATATANGGKGENASPNTARTNSGTTAGEESPEAQRLRLMSEELEKIRAEKENLRLQNEAASEERDRIASENEALKFQFDQRIAQIRAAPMLAKITYVNPEHGVAVMSAGRNANIEPRDEFRIRRGDKIICRVMVGDSIEENEAAIAPIPGSLPPDESIKQGDEVVSLE